MYEIDTPNYALRRIKGTNYEYFYLNTDDINYEKAFYNFLRGDTSSWQAWDNPPDDAPRLAIKPKISPIPNRKGGTQSVKSDNSNLNTNKNSFKTTGGGKPPYKVQKGENLATIAKKYGLKIEEIRKLNPKTANIKDADDLEKAKISELQLPQGAKEQKPADKKSEKPNYSWNLGANENANPQEIVKPDPVRSQKVQGSVSNQSILPEPAVEEMKPFSELRNSENTGIVTPSTNNTVNKPLHTQINKERIAQEWAEKEAEREAKRQRRSQLLLEQHYLKPVNDKIAADNGSRAADPKIQSSAVDNTRIATPFVVPNWSEFKPDRSQQGWFEIAGELIVGFSPAGIILDIADFVEALATGNLEEIFIAGIGFLPCGDFFKTYKKAEKQADGIFEDAMRRRFGDGFDKPNFDENFFQNPNNKPQGIASFADENGNLNNANAANSNTQVPNNQANTQQIVKLTKTIPTSPRLSDVLDENGEFLDEFLSNQKLILQGVGIPQVKLPLAPKTFRNNTVKSQYDTSIKSIENSIKDHLKDSDITGYIKDKHSFPSGGNHLQEVGDAIRGIKSQKIQLQKLLKENPPLLDEAAESAKDAIQTAQFTLTEFYNLERKIMRSVKIKSKK